MLFCFLDYSAFFTVGWNKTAGDSGDKGLGANPKLQVDVEQFHSLTKALLHVVFILKCSILLADIQIIFLLDE